MFQLFLFFSTFSVFFFFFNLLSNFFNVFPLFARFLLKGFHEIIGVAKNQNDHESSWPLSNSDPPSNSNTTFLHGHRNRLHLGSSVVQALRFGTNPVRTPRRSCTPPSPRTAVSSSTLLGKFHPQPSGRCVRSLLLAHHWFTQEVGM